MRSVLDFGGYFAAMTWWNWVIKGQHNQGIGFAIDPTDFHSSNIDARIAEHAAITCQPCLDDLDIRAPGRGRRSAGQWYSHQSAGCAGTTDDGTANLCSLLRVVALIAKRERLLRSDSVLLMVMVMPRSSAMVCALIKVDVFFADFV